MKIRYITEAFSMQPATHFVSSEEDYNKSTFSKDTLIKEIKHETRQVDSHTECNYVVGYYFNGNIAFEYPQSSVSVYYFNTPTP